MKMMKGQRPQETNCVLIPLWVAPLLDFGHALSGAATDLSSFVWFDFGSLKEWSLAVRKSNGCNVFLELSKVYRLEAVRSAAQLDWHIQSYLIWGFWKQLNYWIRAHGKTLKLIYLYISPTWLLRRNPHRTILGILRHATHFTRLASDPGLSIPAKRKDAMIFLYDLKWLTSLTSYPKETNLSQTVFF